MLVTPPGNRGIEAGNSPTSTTASAAAAIAALIALALAACAALPGEAAAASQRYKASRDVSVPARSFHARFGHGRVLRIGGRGRWRTYLRFRVTGVRGSVR
ncbi:MAG TPA: hypothetical protein VLA98_04695, partial [Solirubrobacteraceae bacterium]|nr:hypothetical protein [Solirubrobacteraceae bacterium]